MILTVGIIVLLIVVCCLAYAKKLQKYSLLLLVVAVMFVIGNSLTIVSVGHVKVGNLFGAMQEGYYEEGLNFVNPFLSFSEIPIRRQSIDFTGENAAQGVSSDPMRLKVDITIPYIPNPVAIWKIVQRYGEGGWNLVTPNSRRAIRDCTARETWMYTMGREGRQKLSDCVTTRLSELVVADLKSAGFDEHLSLSAFTFPPAILREVLPTDKVLLNAIAQNESSKKDLERQKTLTKIAEEEANRRENEGAGVAKMMSKLPRNYKISEMVAIIKASAAKTHADAFMKSVENGNPNISIVVDGSGNTGIAKMVK